jgi:hypothetical protein
MDVSRSIVVLALVAGVGCAADKPPAATGETDTTRSPEVDRVVSGEAIVLPGAAVDRPSGWVVRPPSSSMRLAEAEVPGPGGPALLTVFFFGPGGGGGVDANLDRWAGQIEADPGVEATRGSFAANGFEISTIDLEGTLLPSRMGGPSEPAPGSRLIGAVISGPGGPWFFKMTGPKDTVAAAAPAFEQMLRSVRPGP